MHAQYDHDPAHKSHYCTCNNSLVLRVLHFSALVYVSSTGPQIAHASLCSKLILQLFALKRSEKELQWTEVEVKLLLNVTYEYKTS